MLAFIVRWKIISRLVKRPRTLICVDPEFTNPNIASACPRERWNWYSKGRKRKREGKWRKGEGNGIKSREREKKKREREARWKREPKNRPTSADLPNSHACG